MHSKTPLVTLENLVGGYEKPYLIDYMKIGGWLPIFPSKELAGIVADLMGDGHIQGKPRWKFDYTSYSTKNLFDLVV